MAVSSTVLVTGATGAQGGGVASHLLASGKFKVRCLTRNPDSEKAAALKSAGAEVVKGDLSNRASIEAALKGCYGVFGVTNFWEHFGAEAEHGRNLVEAVAAAPVEHFIFSTLPDARKLSGGELDVPHFQIKAEIEEQIRARNLRASFVSVAFYYENFLRFLPPRKQEDGSLAFGFPQGDTPLAAVAVEDTGGVVAAMFDKPDEFLGKTVGVVGEDVPAQTYAEILSRHVGARIVYQHIPREVFATLGFPGAEDLANMFDLNRRFILSRRADAELSRRLYPGMQSFDSWVAVNKSQLRKAFGLA